MTYEELREQLGADEIEEIEALRDQTRRWVTRAAIGFGVLLLCGMLVVLWVASGNERQNDRRAELEGRVSGLEAAGAALAGELDDANSRLEAAGQQPVGDPEDVIADATDEVEPTVIVGPRGPAGEQGSTGPVGPEGPVGKEGAMGPIGPPGAKGDTGSAGADGTDGADGADGAPGVDGSPGSSGRGIVSQDCVNGDLVTTYTDGTTSTITDSPACPNGPPPIVP